MKEEHVEQALSRDLHEALLRRILNGEFAPGARLVESKLSQEMKVSRTPLREALFTLTREGFVVSEINRGFSVKPLTAGEARDLYPVLWTLESLALSEAYPLIPSQLDELSRINRAFSKSKGDKARQLDTEWHQTLIEKCPNRHLLSILEWHRRLIDRYERLYMTVSELIAASFEQHAAIVESLREGSLAQALRNLEANWKHGLRELLLHIGRD